MLWLDDITILLANAKLGLVDLVESQMRSKQALAEAWAIVEASGINKAAWTAPVFPEAVLVESYAAMPVTSS